MNCGLHLTMEAHFVDNCLGEENKTGAVVNSEQKDRWKGMCITCMGKKTLRPPPSCPNTHPEAHRKDLADFIIYALHM